MNLSKKYRLFPLMLLAVLCFCKQTNAQEGTTITATVVDNLGAPLSGVEVYGPKGIEKSTDAQGKFQLTIAENEVVRIQKEGYEKRLLQFADLTENIVLQQTPYLASWEDEIKMGVATKTKREITGAVSTVETKERLPYDNTQGVRNYINGALLLGVEGSNNIRSFNNALYVIDGVLGRDPNLLNMEEIDQITVLKDANTLALYGNQGRNGVIIINTKRGEINKNSISVAARSGLRVPVALPNYLGSVEYMELFNEARRNDGLDNFYDPELIEDFRTGSNDILYPDVDFYSDEYLLPFVSTSYVVSEFTGGDEKYQYYVNLGWNYDQDIVKANDDADGGTNRFNIRGNIDFKVNDWIDSSIDGVAVIRNNQSPLGNLLNAGRTFRPNDYAPLLPIDLIDVEGNPSLAALLTDARIIDGNILGATQQFQNNTPVADLLAGGYQNTITRATQFNNAVNFDLKGITQGLSAKTYLSFDFINTYRTFVSNDFRVYEPEFDGNRIVNLTPFGNLDLNDQTQNVRNSNFISRLGFYALINYDKTFGEAHTINTTLLGYFNKERRDEVIQSNNDAHVGFQIGYNYRQKLYLDFSAVYINSLRLPEGERGGLSPTVGAAYIISEEPFLKDNNFVDYLKLKASAGIIKSDLGINGYYLYEENYTDGSNFVWADQQSENRRQNISQGENLNLGFEERLDLNIGLESYLMNSLWFEVNYFKSEFDKQPAFLGANYPSFYNTFRPLDNFDSDLFTGVEVGIKYDKRLGDLIMSIGANVLYNESEIIQRSEINEFAYQNRVGTQTSTRFGLEDLGFYSESDFTRNASGELVLNDGLAVPGFGDVQPGDLRYRDQNGDNIIDNDDIVNIGMGNSPWSYGLNLNFKLNQFNLMVLGTGQVGGDGNRTDDYFRVDGNEKYSEVVRGRWTPETAETATFPRLSSTSNQNNFRNSTFWQYDNSFFRINRAQLTFTFDDNFCDQLGVRDFSLNAAGDNILQIAENKDIRELNIGGVPQFSTFTLGLRMTF
ncbi:MAG: SusC/RagA family TonB-linked outer membrane protein [Leeuwenhoekiella sp.]